MSGTVLEDITEALETWSGRILSVETRIKRTNDWRQNITESLERQVLDGFISEKDSYELGYVADLWNNLYKSFMCRVIGVEFADRDVFAHLLELFVLKQISTDFFIQIALRLCRSPVSTT